MAYDRDILDEPARPRRTVARVAAVPGLVVQDRASRFTGVVVAVAADAVTLRAADGRERSFRWKEAAFTVDGRLATLVRPTSAAPTAAAVTASGSVASAPTAAQVAKASRIWVEGIHDAELLEHVWGDDLREAGIVVEPLGGIDGLVAAVEQFRPSPERRLGVLVDHLVPGSKEQRIASQVRSPHVLVTGTPFVDVWQGVRPRAVGIEAWPVVPPGRPWKDGVCAALGAGEPAAFWKRLRNRVRTYADLEPELVGAVEQLLDFVVVPP